VGVAQATTHRDLSTRTPMTRGTREIEEVAILTIREASNPRALITKETHVWDTAEEMALDMRRRRPATGSFMTLLFPLPNTLRIKKRLFTKIEATAATDVGEATITTMKTPTTITSMITTISS